MRAGLWPWVNRPARNLADLLGTGSAFTGTASSADSAAVEAVVSFSAPTDLAALYASSPQAGKAVVQFLGGPPMAVPGNYVAASPVDQVRPGEVVTFLGQAQAYLLGAGQPIGGTGRRAYKGGSA